MAWNEPGNSGGDDKDPWGKKKENQGPPDLEDVFKNFGKKVTSLFGGKGGGGGGSSRGRSSSGGGMGMFALVAIIAVLGWAVSGIYIVDEGSEGVVLQFGKFKEKTQPGPHWYPRFIQEVEVVNISQSRTIFIGRDDNEKLMLTKDNSIVAIGFEVQYRIKDSKDFLFNVIDPEATLKQITESALREIVGGQTFDYVVEKGRQEVGPQVRVIAQDLADNYGTGIEIITVNMQAADPPVAVKSAFDDVVKAKKDYDRFIKEAEKYENEILPVARGDAARMIQDAEAYKKEVVERARGDALRFNSILAEYKKAPRVTRDRLYIETMEYVLGNINKVMIDVDKGNNILYLPIDQLNKNKRTATQTTTGTTTTPRSNVGSSPSVSNPNNTDRSRDRNRDRSFN